MNGFDDSGRRAGDSLTAAARRIAERHEPAYVVTDERFEVIDCTGRCGRFFEPSAEGTEADLRHLVHHDLRVDLSAALAAAREGAQPVQVENAVLETGSERIGVDMCVEPVTGLADRRKGFVVFFQDKRLQPSGGAGLDRLEGNLRATREWLQRANAELARARSDLKNILESSRIATLFLDDDLLITQFTPALTEIVPLAETDIGRPLAQFHSHPAFDHLRELAQHALRTHDCVERRFEDKARAMTYTLRALPYRGPDDGVSGATVTFVDISALARAEQRQSDILADAQHRLRNAMAVTRSLITRTAESKETVDDFASHLQGRLGAFARTQAITARDPAAGIDLEFLVAEELHACRAEEGKQVTIGGPAIRLTARAADNFGLAVHELATNAIKFGALGSAEGTVRIDWSIGAAASGAARLEFRWRESGVPLQVAGERRRGFGMEMLERSLRYQLSAESRVTFEPTGLQCVIGLPLTSDIVVRTG